MCEPATSKCGVLCAGVKSVVLFVLCPGGVVVVATWLDIVCCVYSALFHRRAVMRALADYGEQYV